MVMLSLEDLGDVLTPLELPDFPEDLTERLSLDDLDEPELSLEDLDELSDALEDLDTLPLSLDGLDVLTASLEGLDVFTTPLDLPLLLLTALLPGSVLLELPLFTEPSLLETFELLSECTLE